MPHQRAHYPPRSWMPSAVTAASLSAGFVSILLAAAQRYEHAAYLLVLAIILDTLDGRLARWLRATSSFGQQMDSLNDAVGCGVAPAVLVYLALLHEMGAAGIVVVLAYVMAALFRLARFNLITDAHSKDRRTLGLPTPIGAGYMIVITLMRDELPPIGAAIVILLAAGCMVSHWRLPQLKGSGPATAALLVGIVNFLVVVVWPNWYSVVWWNLWNVVILMATRHEDRKFDLRELEDPHPETLS